MKKITIIVLILIFALSLFAQVGEVKSKLLKPDNTEATIRITNIKTEKGRDYYLLDINDSLKFNVPKGYEFYGFVRTVAKDGLEPDLNVYVNDVLSMLLSVPTDKSIKYSSEEYSVLSRAKKITLSPKEKDREITFTTTSTIPLMVRMYIKKVAPKLAEDQDTLKGGK
ncbi:MAG: hypothetical protein B6226_00385 [Candidatus Cloacimonetes bacterium 4572_65]|nr:MAG: hypothetical protein B6226_00385 [Candidatus Cloacimonetes bacterium 4572_65]